MFSVSSEVVWLGSENRSPRRRLSEKLFFACRAVTFAKASTKRPLVAPITRLGDKVLARTESGSERIALHLCRHKDFVKEK